MNDRRNFCALALAAGLCPSVVRAQADTWKLATGYRVDSFHTKNLQMFLKELAQIPGLPGIELKPDGSLFKLGEIFGAVSEGKLAMGEVIMTSLTKDMPVAGADSVPFVVRSYADAKRLWRYQRPLIEKRFAAAGVRCLMAVPWPPQGLYTNKAVSRASDLQGTKMRTYNPTTVRIAELLGATAVDVPMVQVRQALGEGRIDCMITSAVTGVENQVWGQVKNYYEINAWFPKNATFVNAKAFDALPAHIQSAFLGAAAQAEDRGWAESEKVAVESVEELRKRGIKIERVSSEFLADIKRMGERFSLEWIKQVGLDANEVFIPYFTKQQ